MKYLGEIVFFIVSFVFIFFFKDKCEHFIGGNMPLFGKTHEKNDCSINPPKQAIKEEIIENMSDSATKCFSCEADLGYKGNNTKCFSCEAQLGAAGQQKKCFSCNSTLLDNSTDAFMPNCKNCDNNLRDSGHYFLLQ